MERSSNTYLAEVEFTDRLKQRMMPETLKPDDDVLEFIQRGGRLLAVDYTKSSAEERQEGFAQARKYLNGRPLTSVVGGQNRFNPGDVYHHPNPNNPKETFAPIHPLHAVSVDDVIEAAEKEAVDPAWDGSEKFEHRRAVLDRFMVDVYKDRHTYAGLMALSQGKTAFEVYRDMQEHFDFWRWYRYVDEVIAMKEVLMHSQGDTAMEYKPLRGLVGIWQPFNFNCIGIGDAQAALLMGNSVVIHTSERNVGPYKWLFDKLIDAGVPPSRVQFVIPHPEDKTMSEALAQRPEIQLIQFTGSHRVAQLLHKIQAQKVQEGVGYLDYKLHAESSGYNPILIAGVPKGSLESLEAFVSTNPKDTDWDVFLRDLPQGSFVRNFCNAMVDSTTGLQAHKCSTCKEVIVALDEDEEAGVTADQACMLKTLLVERLKRVKIGSVEEGGVDYGALIDAKMHGLTRKSLERIVAEGGKLLTADSIDELMNVDGRPNAMRMALYEAPHGLTTMDKVEVFAPVTRWNEVEGRDAAVERATNLGYDLTAAVIAETEEQAKAIRGQLRQGVAYISGSEGQVDGCTGAPAPQIPFGGSGKSGTGDLIRPGNSEFPLRFTGAYARPDHPREDWGKNRSPDPVMASLDAYARRAPEVVKQWVRENIELTIVGRGEDAVADTESPVE